MSIAGLARRRLRARSRWLWKTLPGNYVKGERGMARSAITSFIGQSLSIQIQVASVADSIVVTKTALFPSWPFASIR